jgi:Reverse transcriptase (RNA-dependent DNA polymerase).
MQDLYRKCSTNAYILKCDVRKYFASIDKEILKDILSAKIKDKDVFVLIKKIIDSYNVSSTKGLPIGNQTSQWFALFYLDKIDRLIKEKLRIKYYTRYMDDMILLHESKDYLKYCLKEMKKLAEELKLGFNEKTQIFPVKNGVDYLGFRFYLTDTGKVIRRLRTSSKKRFKRRLKKFTKYYNEYKIGLLEITRSIASYKGHLKHGHIYKLKKKNFSNFVLTQK